MKFGKQALFNNACKISLLYSLSFDATKVLVTDAKHHEYLIISRCLRACEWIYVSDMRLFKLTRQTKFTKEVSISGANF
jgi:hypothetical protein